MIIHLTGENTSGTLTLVSNALVDMLYVMKIRFNVKLKLKMRRNILHENINIMNTVSDSHNVCGMLYSW